MIYTITTLRLLTQSSLLRLHVSGDHMSHFTASKDPFTSYLVCEKYATELDILNYPFISPNQQFRVLVNHSGLSMVKCDWRLYRGGSF